MDFSSFNQQGTSEPSTRRDFLQALVAGSAAGWTLGCSDPRNRNNQATGVPSPLAASALGLSFLFHQDGSFDLKADPSQVVLWGLFTLGTMPLRWFRVGNAALTLVNRTQQVQWVAEVATSYLKAENSTQNETTPQKEKTLELDVTSELENASKVNVETEGDGEKFVISDDLEQFDLFQSWKSPAPDGSTGRFLFQKQTEQRYLIQSKTFIGPAQFQIESQEKVVLDSLPAGNLDEPEKGEAKPQQQALVIQGTVKGIFSADTRSRVPRIAPLKLTVRDSKQIDAETEFIKWDNSGRETDRVFWPFHMINRDSDLWKL